MGQGEGFSVPVDAAGLVRRECPACHRVFKVRAGDVDAQDLARALGRQLPHANEDELEACAPERFCPYCGATAPEDGWLPAEQRAAVAKRAEHLQREVRYAQLALPRKTLGQNPYLTYLPVPPEPFQPALDEPGDALKPFPLVCCRETLRIQSSWYGPVRCHFCGAEHEIDPVLPGFLDRLGSGGLDI